jgi:hypothetical protein
MAIGNGVLTTAPPPNGKEHSGMSTAPEGGFPESDGCALRLHTAWMVPTAILPVRRSSWVSKLTFWPSTRPRIPPAPVRWRGRTRPCRHCAKVPEGTRHFRLLGLSRHAHHEVVRNVRDPRATFGTAAQCAIALAQSALMLASRMTRPKSSYCLRRRATNSAPHIPTG